MTSSTSSDAPSTEPDVAAIAAEPVEPDGTVAPEEGRPRRQVWGRRQGPKLRPNRRSILEERLPEVGFTLPESGRLDLRALFGGEDRPVWLEIGFGAGEHLAWQAEANPEVGLIGVEPFINGVARLLLTALPDASLERAFVLFPDPWPKLRHQKRRIVNSTTAAGLARVLKPGAELRTATDDPDYARWMLEALLAEPRLEWTAERAADWRERPNDWPATRYEEKALAAGRRPTFLRFRRIGY